MPFGPNCTSSEKKLEVQGLHLVSSKHSIKHHSPSKLLLTYTQSFTLTITHAVFSSPMLLSSCCRPRGLLEAETIEYTLCACHFGTGAMQTEGCEFIQ